MLRIRTRLLLGFATCIVSIAVLGAIAYHDVSALNGTTGEVERAAFLDEQIMSLEIAAREALQAESQALVSGAVDPTVTAALERAFETNGGDAIPEALAAVRSNPTGAMASKLDAAAAAAATFEQSVRHTVDLVAEGNLPAAMESHALTTMPLFEAFLAVSRDVAADAQALGVAARRAAATTSRNGHVTTIAITVATASVASLIAFLLSQGIHRRLGRLRVAVDAGAAGDFTLRARSRPGGDEIEELGASVNGMFESVGGLVARIAAVAGQLLAASGRIAASAEQTGRAVNEIASAVGEVAAGAERQVRMVEAAKGSAEQMSGAVDESSGSAHETARAAEEAREIAEQGVRAAEQVSDAMELVRASTEEARDAIAGLGAKSEEIGGIVATITGIAGQTNLLALNAAIEAARAGDQGRGFAVVADEVRKLAEESQRAAASIAELIGEIQSETQKAVSIVADGARRTAEGAGVVDGAREAFARIGAAVADMSERIGDIARSSERVAIGGEQLQREISEVAAVAEESSAVSEQVSASTEQTSATAQEFASAAAELAQTARDLNELLARFTVTA